MTITILCWLAMACNASGPPGERPSAHETKTAEPSVYRIGYMICNSEEETLFRFKPLTAYLSKKMGVRFEAVAVDTVDYTKEVSGLDFTHTNSLLYIIMNRFHGVEILAAEKSGSLGSRARGMVVALKKSGIETLADLKGKKMIFGPALGPVSYMSQIDLLQRENIDIERDLALYVIPQGSFKHEKVIYGVWFGKYDAGAVPLSDFEKMVQKGRIDRQDFRILAQGESVPYCNFARTQRVDDETAKRFKEALLTLAPEETVEIDGEIIKVLGRAGIDGYEAAVDKEFDDLRAMARRTNMPPYQRY